MLIFANVVKKKPAILLKYKLFTYVLQGWRLQSVTRYSFRVGWRTAGKGLIAVFQDFFASLNKILIFAGGMGTGLSFYGGETLS